jgi:hypothetical protein
MSNRHLLRTSRIYALLAALALAGAGFGVTQSASANTSGGFSYETGHWTTVDISLAGGDGSPALLSFYSEGANGLRLLENGFTDPQGLYAADLRLPAHLTQVVVVVRTADRQDTLTLPIGDHTIAYTE